MIALLLPSLPALAQSNANTGNITININQGGSTTTAGNGTTDGQIGTENSGEDPTQATDSSGSIVGNNPDPTSSTCPSGQRQVAISNYPKGITSHQQYYDVIGEMNWRCSHICMSGLDAGDLNSASNKSKIDGYLDSAKSGSDSIYFVNSLDEFNQRIIQGKDKTQAANLAKRTIVSGGYKESCQGPNSVDYTNLTRNGQAITLQRKNTAYQDISARGAEGQGSNKLKVVAAGGSAPDASQAAQFCNNENCTFVYDGKFYSWDKDNNKVFEADTSEICTDKAEGEYCVVQDMKTGQKVAVKDGKIYESNMMDEYGNPESIDQIEEQQRQEEEEKAARVAKHKRVGGTIGAAVGAAGGGLAGAAAGAAYLGSLGAFAGPVGIVLGGAIGAIAGALGGSWIGGLFG